MIAEKWNREVMQIVYGRGGGWYFVEAAAASETATDAWMLG